MTALLNENLPLVAGAPNGIKKLRELILELAVRGKLVPQNPSDEQASELLKRIESEKKQLIERKVLRKEKPLPDIEQDEMKFKLPMGWEWIRLGQIGDWGAGATPARGNANYYGGEMPWFKSGELVADFISVSEEMVTELALKECSLRRNKPGDVLVAMYGATIGKTAILSVEGTTNQAVCACTAFNGLFNRYLLLILKALKTNFIGQGAGGAQPNISREKIVATVAALPPLAEQHRIVAKVDELMALCDRLEAQQADAESAHAQLVQALLNSLTQASDATDFAANWQRLAEYFHTLFTTETSIDALKQTLLQLAVMGKLVPQDPSDEPASKLLKRIHEEKSQLVAEGKLKKQKPLLDVGEEERPFELPNGWQWVRLGNIVEAHTGHAFKSSEYTDSGTFVLRVTNINPDGTLDLSNAKYIDTFSANTTYQNVHLEAGEVLLVMVGGSLGKIGIVDEICLPAVLNQNMWKIFRPQSINRDYLIYGLKLINTTQLKITNSTHGHLAQGEYLSKLFPLPPENEQHRIVRKVDEFISLCDSLKQQICAASVMQSLLLKEMMSQALRT